MRPTLEEALELYGITAVHPVAEMFPMFDDEAYEALVADVDAQGWLNPVVLNGDGVLLDGRNRLVASIDPRLQLDVPIRRIDASDETAWILSENMHRRHLTALGRAAVAAKLMEYERAQAKERMSEGGGDRKSEAAKSGGATLPHPIGEDRAPRARDIVAAQVGIGARSVDKAVVVAEYAPEQFDTATNLEEAYRVAQDRKREAETPKPLATVIHVVGTDGTLYDYPKSKGKEQFNRTNDAVDWAGWTWNPVTGCRQGCDYCYARDIALSGRMQPFYPAGFEPAFLEHRLAAPANTPKPTSDDPTDGRVFVCSMADLFGEWVPQEWIDKVFDACLTAPDWEYLFLTKTPKRYRRINLPPKAWFGVTVDTQARVRAVEDVMPQLDVSVRWLSVEPLLEPLTFNDLSWCDLLVIGAQSATTQPDGRHPAVAPDFRWVADLVRQADDADVPVYLKPNLLGVPNSAKPGMVLPVEAPRSRA